MRKYGQTTRLAPAEDLPPAKELLNASQGAY
jgi:hypothetical protein